MALRPSWRSTTSSIITRKIKGSLSLFPARQNPHPGATWCRSPCLCAREPLRLVCEVSLSSRCASATSSFIRCFTRRHDPAASVGLDVSSCLDDAGSRCLATPHRRRMEIEGERNVQRRSLKGTIIGGSSGAYGAQVRGAREPTRWY